VRQDFSTTYEDSIGSIFNHGRRDIISGREKNAIKFFACPTGKYHSAYSLYALNELNVEPSGSNFARYGSGSGFGSGCGSGSFYHQTNKNKKNLDSYCFGLLYDFIS
jgi:hypothetical protein